MEGNQQRALAAPALELDRSAYEAGEQTSAQATAVLVVRSFGLAGGGGQQRGAPEIETAIEIAFQFRCAA